MAWNSASALEAFRFYGKKPSASSATSRLVRPLSFKETILCLAYLDRFAVVCLHVSHTYTCIIHSYTCGNVELHGAEFRFRARSLLLLRKEAFRFFGRSLPLLWKKLPLCGGDTPQTHFGKSFRSSASILKTRTVFASVTANTLQQIHPQWLVQVGSRQVSVSAARETLVTPCACAAGGRVIGLCLSVCPQSKRCLSSEGLIEGLFQDRSVRIQKILAST